MPNIRQLGNPTVTVSGTCWHCQGLRVVPNPVWDLFDSWKREWDANNPRPPMHSEAWASFVVREQQAEMAWWSAQGHDGFQPEQIACSECHGLGVIAQSWPLDEFAALIYEHATHRRRLAGVR